MKFENGKEITRICENGKDIIARYCEGHLIWTNGIKLRSLLGKQNVSLYREFANITFYPNQDNGFENYWSSNCRTAKRIANHKYFMYAQIDIPSYAWCYFGMWDTSSTGYDGNRTDEVYKNGNDMFAIIEPTTSKDDSVPSFQFGGTEKATIYKAIILDLTQAKLDTLTAQQVYDLITLNGTDFTNLELLASGYEIKLGSFNNLGKYGFIKLKDLDYSYESDNTRFYSSELSSLLQASYDSKPNIFCSKYSTVSTLILDSGIQNCITTNNSGVKRIFIRDTRFTNGIDLKNSFTDEDILVFELNTSLGNKLDNYTAEQVYYMFFSTLGMNKMYVPYGKRFESADNVIIGTKYGIVDLGNLGNYTYDNNWWGTGKKRFYVYLPTNVRGKGLTTNLYLEGYSTLTINQHYVSDTDMTVSMDEDGFYVNIRNLSYTDGTTLKNSLKGKYLIYELASPNGTDYNDLSAKEMYDVINDNAIDILANGKNVGGVRSIVGKYNNLQRNGTQTYYNWITFDKTGWDYYTVRKANGEFNLSLNTTHIYLFVANFKENISIDFGGMSNGNDSNFTVNSKAVVGKSISCKFTHTSSAVVNCFRINWNSSSEGVEPISAIIIDLTENNLQNLTAQEAYQYFKEHNLQKLDKESILLIGGYIKS